MRTGPWLIRRLPWYTRFPLKWGMVALTILFVCFPYPRLLYRHISHLNDPNSLIEPNIPALQPLIDSLRPVVERQTSSTATLQQVESFVYERIPYAWDWDNWGNSDYLPTAAEVIERGREDCDGRAVVAASLLMSFGFQAELVSDFGHVWVKTDQGETMSPGRKKAVIATDQGVEIQPGALMQLLENIPYGIAVFPLPRELVVVGLIWLLLLRRGSGVPCALVGLGLLINGVLFMRIAKADYWRPMIWPEIVGLVNFLAGILATLIWPGIRRGFSGNHGDARSLRNNSFRPRNV